MSKFKKELIKVLILLGIGVVLLVLFMIKGHLKISSFFVGWEEMVVGLAIPCYPIGIVYGGGVIWRLFCGVAEKGQYTEEEFAEMSSREVDRANKANLVSIILFLAITIMFGWIIGVFKACKKLYILSREVDNICYDYPKEN
ncbi:hypothetical protein [Clostridium beijerinckii]|uniref:hypothetical protein n=1 Tax=Clostridium beijerinckii TaxID=1520 RepID=UPI0022E5A7D3|nr:hypothetical protein [Clostridium beijerinckii]